MSVLINKVALGVMPYQVLLCAKEKSHFRREFAQPKDSTFVAPKQD